MLILFGTRFFLFGFSVLETLISFAAWASLCTKLSWADWKCGRYDPWSELCICWCWDYILKWFRIGMLSTTFIVDNFELEY